MNSDSYKKYYCLTCDLIYDEALGFPEEGINAGVRFDDIPEDWSCPDCSASKADFILMDGY